MGARRICVLGGGNGAHAAAADLEERGHDVAWWRRDGAAFDAIRAQGGLRVVDHRGERVARPRLEAEIGAAVEGAELIVAPLPAFAQADLADALAPHLRDGQVVFLPPGTFGSWLMPRRLRALGCEAQVTFAETGTLPWLCRKPAEGAIRITTRASRLPTGALPASRSAEALGLIAEAFPGAIEPVEDALSAALMNAGPIIHPPLILMNAGPIEHFDAWDIHAEGTQPSIRRVHDALDAERIALREALGYGPPHFPLRDHYETSDWMYGNLAHDRLVASKDWHEALDLSAHRYMREDVVEGLSFLASLAAWTGAPAPVAAGLLAIGGAACGRDLPAEGRSAASLGLEALDREGLSQRLRDGF
ncbi:MAG: NAD/NADP octopine/nopaline dehydrogenase family protein [Pseudomonadota bacterium]